MLYAEIVFINDLHYFIILNNKKLMLDLFNETWGAVLKIAAIKKNLIVSHSVGVSTTT